MRGRHRSPADGARSGPVGVGMAPGQISPEGSFQGHRMYNTSYRNYGRGGGGFRRGPPKSYLPPPQPPRKADIFMEAGRLAAEYLVSKGLLPPNSLSPAKPYEGRTSALARLGSTISEGGGSSRRRYNNDEFTHGRPRYNNGRGGRRRSYNRDYGYGSDWGRENGVGRSGQWVERGSRAYPDLMMEGEDDFAPGYNGDRRGGGADDGIDGGGVSKSATDEQASKSEITGESESELENCDFPSSTRKDLPSSMDVDLNKGSDDGKVSNFEMEGEKTGEGCAELVKENALEEKDLAVQPCPVEDELAAKQSNDLLRLCRFGKVPTKPRTLIANRSPKADQAPPSEAINTCDAASMEGSKIPAGEESTRVIGVEESIGVTGVEESIRVTGVEESIGVAEVEESIGVAAGEESIGVAAGEDCIGISASDSFTIQTRSLICKAPEISRALSDRSLEKYDTSDPMFAAEGEKCIRSRSFSESSSFTHYQQASSHDLPGLEISGPTVGGREDNLAQQAGHREGVKRPRDWSLTITQQSDEYFHMRNLRGKQSSPPDEINISDEEMVEVVDQEKSTGAELFPKVETESLTKMEEEKQFLSSSFKICDLNLIGPPEITEIPDDPVLDPISTTAPSHEIVNEPSVDFGLSIGHNSNNIGEYGLNSSDNKVIPVIDLDIDSPVAGTAFDTSKPKNEQIYPNLENFLNNTDNTVELPDIQDEYGLRMSDLLGTDISSSPSLQADLNNLQNGMTLHGEEGIPGDDDPIYVSLGEIPIGFMEVWDQPSQEYDGEDDYIQRVTLADLVIARMNGRCRQDHTFVQS